MGANRIDQLRQFLKEDPTDPFLLFALATEHLKLGDEEDALEHFEQLRETNPDYVGTYYHLAKLYVQLGRNDEAFETFEQGIRVASTAGDHHSVSELRSAKMELEIDE